VSRAIAPGRCGDLAWHGDLLPGPSTVSAEGFLSTGGMSDMNADGVLHAFYRDAPYLFLGAAFTP
jgi:hypothetical protein